METVPHHTVAADSYRTTHHSIVKIFLSIHILRIYSFTALLYSGGIPWKYLIHPAICMSACRNQHMCFLSIFVILSHFPPYPSISSMILSVSISSSKLYKGTPPFMTSKKFSVSFKYAISLTKSAYPCSCL